MIITPQAYGKQFENEIHAFLSRTNPDLLLNETQVRKHDVTITAIDHLLIMNNICFCFQDKWLTKSISISDFNHFIKCVELVAIKMNNSMKIYGIYISNTDFSSIAKTQFDKENNKYIQGQANIEYVKINNLNKQKIFNELHILLHSNNVFMYDNNDCIML